MQKKVALINDMLVQEGGQERVLRALQELFPQAPTFVLIYDQHKKERFYKNRDLRPSFLQKMPLATTHYQWYLPLMSTAIEAHDLSDFDLIISSSSSFAKGIIARPTATHICYCHTPTRYLWSDWQGYVEDLPYPNFIKKFLPFYLSHLRQWDWAAAQRVNYFIANSQTVKKRIKSYYARDAEVVYPPVEVEKFQPAEKIGNYYLIGGRLVPYKRYDLAIRAFNKLNLPLKIFGAGPEFERLRMMAKPNIEFLGEVSELWKAKLYAECLAFINPQEEDFGITAVEAMAAGRPVIAYRAGGATETVIDGLTGQFFTDQCWEDLANTIIHFQPENYDPVAIRRHALQFGKERFKNEINQFINNLIKNG